MKKNCFINIILFSCLLSLHYNVYSQSTSVGKTEPSHQAVKTLLPSFKISGAGFLENKGQVRGPQGDLLPEVRFVVTRGDIKFFIREDGISYQFMKMQSARKSGADSMKETPPSIAKKMNKVDEQVHTETYRMDLTFKNCNPHPKITAEGKSVDYVHYYNYEIMNAHYYEKVIFSEIYPGIDWMVYASDQGVKYDFVVHPDADPTVIQMVFSDYEDLFINRDGGLSIVSRLGTITEKAPVSFQGRQPIATHFLLKGNSVSFNLADYNKQQKLVIDPSIIWSTYYGGEGQDEGYKITTDNLGNVYASGATNSTVNMASGGYQNSFGGGLFDGFLVKFNSQGVRLWAAYYGGSGTEGAWSCATDFAGNVYISGQSSSTTGIAASGYQNTYGGGTSDAMLIKFNSAGVRQWGTYYGGTDSDTGWEVVVDNASDVYLTGQTASTVGIASGGHQNTYGGGPQDGFLVKFNSAGVRQWATYYGGSATDRSSGCTTDGSNNVFMTGYTTSTAAIASGGHQQTFAGGTWDSFLVKFNSAGVRQWGTYYGGSGFDASEMGSCTTDALGNVFLCGATTSSASIASGGFQNTGGGATNYDVFLVKFNANGVRQWGTYYGDAGYEVENACAADISGNVILSGNTSSTVNIASNGFQNTHGGGGVDAFFAVFSPVGGRVWASYFGSTGIEDAYDCHIDANGSIYLTGRVSSTLGIAMSAHQATLGGSLDAFVVKICSNSGPLSSISGSSLVCQGNNYVYSLTAVPNATFNWALPAGWPGSSNSNTIDVTAGGASGTISVSVNDLCGVSPTQTLAVFASTNTPSAPAAITGNTSVCVGSTQIYSITPDPNTLSYAWILPPGWVGSSNTASTGAVVFGGVMLSVAAVNGCGTSGAVSLSVNVNPLPLITASNGTICTGNSYTIIPSGASTYTYSEPTATVLPASAVVLPIQGQTNYSITGTSSLGCQSASPAIITVTAFANPTLSVNSGSICQGKTFTLVANGAATYVYPGGSALVAPLTSTSYPVTGTSSAGCVSGSAAVASITVFTLPAISINGQGVICLGATATLSATGAISYVWQGGSSNNVITVSPPVTGSYSVIGTDANGCQNTAIKTITVNPLPVITASTSAAQVCASQATSLFGGGALTYSWTGGVNNGISFVPVASANYSVYGTDANGCENSASITITVNILPFVSANASALSICLGSSVTLEGIGAVSFVWSGGIQNNTPFFPTLSSTYTVTGTDNNGCSNTATVSVTVNLLPVLTSSSTATVLCAGESCTLSVSGANFYFWNIGGNSGQVAISPAATSTYTVTGTDVNGCVTTLTVTQEVNACTGLNPATNVGRDCKIYPNPGLGLFYLEFPMFIQEGTLEVYSLNGQLIFEKPIDKTTTLIDLTHYPAGMYVLRISGRDISEVRKICKE